MAEKFYSTIVEEEKKTHKIEANTLMAAAKSLSGYLSTHSVGKRQSFRPANIYDKPSNRCVYLYRYATINTGLVINYFQKMLQKKDAKMYLRFKETIKICCLGGGPGTDVYGVFKALAVDKSFHGKITEVSVLDVCRGWENTFNRVISGFLERKENGVPSTFIDQKKFTFKFLTVNLLDHLPENVQEVISNADIVFMTRFVSEIFGDRRCSNALRVLGDLIKLEALVLCIDRFNDKVFELCQDIFTPNSFETVIGPLHESFKAWPKNKEKEVYGYDPQFAAKFFIIGWRKTLTNLIMNTVFDESYLIANNSDRESEVSSTALEVYDSKDNSIAFDVFNSEDHSSALDGRDSEYDFLNEPLQSVCHTYTQTESEFSTYTISSEKEDMLALMAAVTNLINITEQWKQKLACRKCCCCHRHHHQSC